MLILYTFDCDSNFWWRKLVGLDHQKPCGFTIPCSTVWLKSVDCLARALSPRRPFSQNLESLSRDLMKKILIMPIQMNLVPQSWAKQQTHRNCHFYNNFCHQPTITAISWPQPWISQLFKCFLFGAGSHIFYSLAGFACVDYE